jgi:fructan beta-fructosidase
MKNLIFALFLLFLLVSAKSDSKYYNEKYRPQFHFSPEKDWLFESGGFVFFRGEYHLFYQNVSINNKIFHNQLGHAVSKDLIHWQHMPFAFTPDEKATDMASCRPMTGSAVVDSLNVTGLQQKGDKPMLLFYSDSEGNQNLAYSTDKGVTWSKYARNPIISNPGKESQDPKVFYHAPTGKWVLAYYHGKGKEDNTDGISIYTSADLLNWEYRSFVQGIGECPDVFEVAFEGKPSEKRWVALSGEGNYRIGTFDGISFKPETELQKLDWGKNFFAAQTLSNAPNGKVIQIAWMRGGEYPDMAFNGQMSFPMELSLRSTKKGPVLCRKPVSSLSKIYEHEILKKDKNLIPGIKGNLLGGMKGDAVYIKAVLQPKSSDNFGIIVRNGKQATGTDIHYDTAKKILDTNGVKMALEPVDGKIVLEILVDRASIEILGNNGEMGISTCFSPVQKEDEMILYTQGGELFVESLEVHSLKTTWSNNK